jgi:hypothetical protein
MGPTRRATPTGGPFPGNTIAAMPRLVRRSVGIVAGLALGVAGCGAAAKPLPVACTVSAGAYERALASAPAAVRLTDGTPISTCVARALQVEQLEQVGGLLTSEADRLAVGAVGNPATATALGYLVGATRRGAAQTNGVAAQLARRVETAAALRDAGPASLQALHRGNVAGQTSG